LDRPERWPPQKDLMIGQTISHYKIIEKLGEGGMGVVYEGENLTLRAGARH